MTQPTDHGAPDGSPVAPPRLSGPVPLQLPARTAPELAPGELRRSCEVARLPFETTSELEPLAERIGQTRAVEALHFGVAIRHEGYNVFAMGPANVGKYTAVTKLLAQRAASEPVPSDVCYVTNFAQPHVPRMILLPAGTGGRFRQDIAQLLDDLGTVIPHALESDAFRAKRDAIGEDLKRRNDQEVERLGELAAAKHLVLVQTPMGLVLAPARDGEVIPPEEVAKWTDADRAELQKAVDSMSEDLQKHIAGLPRLHQEAQRRIRDLIHQTVREAVSSLIEDLKKKYSAFPPIVEHLDALGERVVEHGPDFVKSDDGPSTTPVDGSEPDDSPLGPYRVNLLVDNAATQGAPVVYEDRPTVENLVGRIEHRSHFGTLVTDLQLVKPGALHRANGGYLVLDARQLLSQPLAWDALKRALFGKKIRVESLGQMMSLVATVSLEPEPVPLQVKVVLLGERELGYLLEELDPDFSALFKVTVDFEDEVDRTADTDLLYARTIATLGREEGLRAVDRSGVGAIVDRCARLAGDCRKLTASMGALADLLREADHCAGLRGAPAVTGDDVEAAIEAQRRRSGRLRERVLEQIERGTVLIETSGERVGQVNGLSVVELGSCAFGYPVRITARVRVGHGRIVDIEREATLGGPIHSKGVMILSGLLAGRYAQSLPLSLAATLVFEQSYGHVEGDSASSAELYALLSALASVPLLQSIAVTGSVNQHGEIQPVGGINEKVEGFFDVCLARGLTGSQGVVVPASNAPHLMLRREVVEAVRARRFHVWPIRSVDEGIEILSGMVAGERTGNGLFVAGTFNAKVEARLVEFAQAARKADA